MQLPTNIRAARPHDAHGIATVHVEGWRTTYAGLIRNEVLDNLSVDQRQALWEDVLRDAEAGHSKFTFVAEQGTEIVGFIDGGPAREITEHEAELYAVYLLAHRQGEGLGRQLMQAFVKQLVKAGYRSAIVGVLAGNPSCGFYERLGARYIHSRDMTIGGATLEERFYRWPDLQVLL